jgi:hypothetical protein
MDARCGPRYAHSRPQILVPKSGATSAPKQKSRVVLAYRDPIQRPRAVRAFRPVGLELCLSMVAFQIIGHPLGPISYEFPVGFQLIARIGRRSNHNSAARRLWQLRAA